MICHLLGAKPLPEPMLTYCQLTLRNTLRLNSKIIWKYHLWNGGHFMHGGPWEWRSVKYQISLWKHMLTDNLLRKLYLYFLLFSTSDTFLVENRCLPILNSCFWPWDAVARISAAMVLTYFSWDFLASTTDWLKQFATNPLLRATNLSGCHHLNSYIPKKITNAVVTVCKTHIISTKYDTCADIM